jgi:hypothetical protein
MGGRGLNSINFLPCTIVQGYKWMFVATVEHCGRAVLFQQAPIGDTTSKEGVSKLLLSLQVTPWDMNGREMSCLQLLLIL